MSINNITHNTSLDLLDESWFVFQTNDWVHLIAFETEPYNQYSSRVSALCVIVVLLFLHRMMTKLTKNSPNSFLSQCKNACKRQFGVQLCKIYCGTCIVLHVWICPKTNFFHLACISSDRCLDFQQKPLSYQ